LSAVEFVGVYGTPNMEKVTALKPDLIVGEQFATKEDLYRQLAQIAPTVVIEQFTVSIHQSSAAFARLVGKEAEAARLKTDYEARVTALRQKLGDPSKVVVSLMQLNDKGPFVDGSGGAPLTVMRDIGVAVPTAQLKAIQENTRLQYSLESLPELDADVILTPIWRQDGHEAVVTKTQASPLWATLNAVQQGQAANVDGELFFGNAYQALFAVLEGLEAGLLKANLATGYAAKYPARVGVLPINPYPDAIKRDAPATGAAKPAAGATKSYTDAIGRTVTIPTAPKRIAALHDTNVTRLMLSLGVKPYASTVRQGALKRVDSLYDVSGIESLGEWTAPNIERVAAVKPDLIIGTSFGGKTDLKPEVVAQLERIAPTAFVDPFAPTPKVMEQLGALLGIETQVREKQAAYERRLAAVKGKLAPKLPELTVSLISLYQWKDGQINVYGGPILLLGEVLQALGVRGPAGQPDGQKKISQEAIAEIDADVILISKFAADPPVAEAALFSTLKATRAGQVHELDGEALGVKSYDGLDRVLTTLERILTAADPKVYP
jgi:iron complex transport system substrate-binding protein